MRIQDRQGAWGGREWAIENHRLPGSLAARLLAAHGRIVAESPLRFLCRPWLMGSITLVCLVVTYRLKNTAVKRAWDLWWIGAVYYLPFFVLTHSCQYRYYFPTYVLWLLASIILGHRLRAATGLRTVSTG